MKNNSGRLVLLITSLCLLALGVNNLSAQPTSNDYTWFKDRNTKMVDYSNRFDPGPLSGESQYPEGSKNQGVSVFKEYSPTYIRVFGDSQVELGFKVKINGDWYDSWVMFYYSIYNQANDNDMFFTQVDEASVGLSSDNFYVITDNSWLNSFEPDGPDIKVWEVPVKNKKTGKWETIPIGQAFKILQFTPKYYKGSENNLVKEALRHKLVPEKNKIQRNIEKATNVTIWPFVLESLVVTGDDLYKKVIPGFTPNDEGRRYYYFFRDTDGVYGVVDTWLAAKSDMLLMSD